MNPRHNKSNSSLKNLVLGAAKVLDLVPFLTIVDPNSPLQKNQDLNLLRGDFSRVGVDMNLVSLNLLKSANSKRRQVNYFEMDPISNQGTSIKVVGVGGGGGNAVEHMIACGVRGVEFIVANTDAQALSRSSAHKTILLGDAGLGAGSKPEKGRESALQSESKIRESINGANMLFITAGMGGGTGTGASPVIARIAREMGIFTIGVVTKPFEWEGYRRMRNADLGVDELKDNVDSLAVVLNEKLLVISGDEITQDEAFAEVNDLLKNAVGGIAEIINVPGLVNIDFEDVRTVLSEPGRAMIGTATVNGPNRARIAAEQAVSNPLFEGVDLSGAKGVLTLITAAKGSLRLHESKLAMNAIRAYASPEAHVIYGNTLDESLGDSIRVTVLATGFSERNARGLEKPARMLRTGTDDMPFEARTVNDEPQTDVARGNTSGRSSSEPNQSSTTAPRVWRTDRTQAATAKIDALSEGGIDDLDIPAFLRKQVD